MSRVPVLVADDHAPTRQDVAAALDADGRFRVCAQAGDAPEAIAAALRTRPTLCVLDVRMPGGGPAAAWEITGRLPETLVVMLTVSRADRDLLTALRAGASGYLLKDTPPERLGDALDAVLRGETAVPRALVGALVEPLRDRAPRRRRVVARVDGAALTSREWEVVDLMRRGLPTAEIARRLFVSEGTVRSHIAGALHKLGVPDREAASRLFAARDAAAGAAGDLHG